MKVKRNELIPHVYILTVQTFRLGLKALEVHGFQNHARNILSFCVQAPLS